VKIPAAIVLFILSPVLALAEPGPSSFPSSFIVGGLTKPSSTEVLAAAPVTASTPALTVKPTVIISRAIGEVGEHIVTSREVIVSDAIDQALADPPPQAAESRILNGDEKIFPAEDQKFLDVWIVCLEAKSLAAQPVSRTDLQAAIKKVQDYWAGKSAWQDLEVSNDEIRDIAGRILTARAFEKLKADPQLAPVSDDDAQTYYLKNRTRFGSLPFPALKESIKTFLAKQQTEHRLVEWRDVLRHKYKVRNFIAG